MAKRDLNEYKAGVIDTIYYIPDFISEAEQAFLLHQVNAAPASKWKALKNRRVQNWGGTVESKGLIQQPLPSWLKQKTEKICQETGLFPSPINHVLVNEYLPGQGIMPHQDGPSYFPVVAILSLGSPSVMQFTPHVKLTEELEGLEKVPSVTNLLLMPKSLLIFMDAAYQDFLHGIDGHLVHELDNNLANFDILAGNKDELLAHHSGTRISLTCRYVPKLCRSFMKF